MKKTWIALLLFGLLCIGMAVFVEESKAVYTIEVYEESVMFGMGVGTIARCSGDFNGIDLLERVWENATREQVNKTDLFDSDDNCQYGFNNTQLRFNNTRNVVLSHEQIVFSGYSGNLGLDWRGMENIKIVNNSYVDMNNVSIMSQGSPRYAVNFMLVDDDCTLNLTDCMFDDSCRALINGINYIKGNSVGLDFENRFNFTVENCIFNNLCIGYANITIRFSSMRGHSKLANNNAIQYSRVSIDNVEIRHYNYSLYTNYLVYANQVVVDDIDYALGYLWGNANITNCKFTNHNYFALYIIGSPVFHIIDCESDDWGINGFHGGGHDLVTREYSFNVTVKNEDGFVDGALVTLDDVNGVEVYNDTTDAFGTVGVSNVAYANYSNKWYYRSPFWLNVSKGASVSSFQIDVNKSEDLTLYLANKSDWDYDQELVWKILNLTGTTILKLSESGNLAIAGDLWENTNSPPDGSNIIFVMNDSFWLDENGDLYIKGVYNSYTNSPPVDVIGGNDAGDYGMILAGVVSAGVSAGVVVYRYYKKRKR